MRVCMCTGVYVRARRVGVRVWVHVFGVRACVRARVPMLMAGIWREKTACANVGY